MCSPVPTPFDPALASALVNLVVGRSLDDLERLGVGAPRGGSSRVVYSEDTVVPDRRNPLVALGRRQLRRLHFSLVQSPLVKTALKGGIPRGTKTLLRTTAHEAASRRLMEEEFPVESAMLDELEVQIMETVSFNFDFVSSHLSCLQRRREYFEYST
jgi:hypothetical protein